MSKQEAQGFRWYYAALLVMFMIVAVISLGFQKGAKPLKGVHPLDYILMAFSVVVVIGLVWYYWGKAKARA